jgi:Ca2+-binding EF-hand superfamily protein
MGGGSSAPSSQPPSSPDIDVIASKLELTSKDIGYLWEDFQHMNASRSGHLTYAEFSNYYKCPGNSFVKLLFTSNDVSTGNDVVSPLTFVDYLPKVWDFLTAELTVFVFQMYDVDGSNFLSKQEYERIAKAVYGVEPGKNSAVDTLLRRADSDGNGQVSYEEFQELTKRNQRVNFEGFKIQGAVKNRTGGSKYWDKIAEKRNERWQTKTLHQILNAPK